MAYGNGYLPPGTPPPRTEHGTVTCPNCGVTTAIKSRWELGMTEWSPEECPTCGCSWPDGLALSFDDDEERNVDA